ncbi:MAG: phosphoribosylglycinamide formyltransferase [Alphaproteobacteria bacterium]|jgi:phosphoribosylglycinamide formyltransferase 1|nr:phosphoribosylglycinamide formyltransferase [Alphaproteobacteria bacterium]MBT4709952.1 phosphoribosylglycinamide formyltransferase [Alphaproteobacteria bacterium]MBT5860729.1 phosphoribosylglycinamide formyltransferase [Alphaproteobacteria bacterium]
MSDLSVVVLISGRGSNLQALIDACADPGFPAHIVRVISNRPGAKGLERAAQAGIPTTVIDHTEFPDRAAFDAALSAEINKSQGELVCLAGFMRLLGDDFVGSLENRLINIHPSLLPDFKGLHVHERVIEAGVKSSGCTVHFVRPETDAGPIIAQSTVPVHDHDTPDTLAARVLEAEHVCYPAAVRLIAEGRVVVDDDSVLVDGRPLLAE